MLHSSPATAVAKTIPNIDDVRQLIQQESDFGSSQLNLLKQSINRQQVAQVRQEINALQTSIEGKAKVSDNTLAKIGVGLCLLGEHAEAIDFLKRAGKHPVATFYLGVVHLNANEPKEAEKFFADAGKLGFDEIGSELQRVGAVRVQGRVEDAEKALRAIAGKAVSRAEYSFQMGCILADRGDTMGAVEYFERAVDMDPYHNRALFWLANENARAGNDEEAIQLLERSLSKPPFLTPALLNLGLLYEDNGNMGAAAFCFRRVLEQDPNHERAKLYLKDIDASEGMFVDEDSMREESRLRQLLARNLADFELSVRSRNCLSRLNINTLGDLTRISEQELLASRNFGETSLKELRELMETQNMKIGQASESAKAEQVAVLPTDLTPEQRSAIEMSISDLALSVRARKCMSRLNITTVGELIQRTPDELLSTRNFGVTSLNEIRAKLQEAGLALRND